MEPRVHAIPLAGVVTLAVGFAFSAGTADAQTRKVKCSKQAEAKAKELFESGESYKALSDYAAAMAEYEAAYKTCRRPFLLFNAGQMAWLTGDKSGALRMYRRYLRLAPDGRAAPVAREKFFEAAEEQRILDRPEQAARHYRVYLKLVSGKEAANAETARTRLAEMEATIRTRRGPWFQQPVLPWVVIGVGALAIVGGGFMHSSAFSTGDRYDEQLLLQCPIGCRAEELPQVYALLEDARSEQRSALTAYAFGSALIGAGVVWMYMQQKRPPGARPTPTDADPADGENNGDGSPENTGTDEDPASARDGGRSGSGSANGRGRHVTVIPMAGPSGVGGTISIRF